MFLVLFPYPIADAMGIFCARLEELAELIGRKAGLPQDRGECPALEVSVVVRDGDENAGFFRVPQVTMAPAAMVHEKASSLQGADKLARSNDPKLAHTSSMATATVSAMILSRGRASSGGIGNPSLARASI